MILICIYQSIYSTHLIDYLTDIRHLVFGCDDCQKEKSFVSLAYLKHIRLLIDNYSLPFSHF